MRRDARMLAALFERSMGLGEAWEVLGTWSGEVGGGPDELRAGVARRRGHAVPCPGCGVPCGARDARERTWRHPGVWQSGTHARRAVPRTDCPEHGAGTVPVPWEVRPNSHLAALLGDRVLAARARGRAAGAPVGVFCQVKLSKNRTRIRAEFAPDLGVCRPNPVPPVLVARPRREGRQADGPGGSPSGRGTASHQTNPSASGPSRRTSPTHRSTVPSRVSPSHLAESMASSDT